MNYTIQIVRSPGYPPKMQWSYNIRWEDGTIDTNYGYQTRATANYYARQRVKFKLTGQNNFVRPTNAVPVIFDRYRPPIIRKGLRLPPSIPLTVLEDLL